MKRNKAVFFSSFFVTLIILGFIALIAVADKNTKSISGMMDTETIFQFKKAGTYEADVILFNEKYHVNVSFIDLPVHGYQRAFYAATELLSPVIDTAKGMYLLQRVGIDYLTNTAQAVFFHAEG